MATLSLPLPMLPVLQTSHARVVKAFQEDAPTGLPLRCSC